MPAWVCLCAGRSLSSWAARSPRKSKNRKTSSRCAWKWLEPTVSSTVRPLTSGIRHLPYGFRHLVFGVLIKFSSAPHLTLMRDALDQANDENKTKPTSPPRRLAHVYHHVPGPSLRQ